jgi:hypothetical protein
MRTADSFGGENTKMERNKGIVPFWNLRTEKKIHGEFLFTAQLLTLLAEAGI